MVLQHSSDNATFTDVSSGPAVTVANGKIGTRLAAFEPYTVDEALMGLAKDDAVFLHCLPAHRGEERVQLLQPPAQAARATSDAPQL